MTRQEEILHARNDYGLKARKGYPRVMDETDRYISNAFEAGAKWADEHPSQELKRQIIDKVVKWLESNRHIKDDVVWHLYIDNFKSSMIKE
jgi:hypothetical protein